MAHKTILFLILFGFLRPSSQEAFRQWGLKFRAIWRHARLLRDRGTPPEYGSKVGLGRRCLPPPHLLTPAHLLHHCAQAADEDREKGMR